MGLFGKKQDDPLYLEAKRVLEQSMGRRVSRQEVEEFLASEHGQQTMGFASYVDKVMKRHGLDDWQTPS